MPYGTEGALGHGGIEGRFGYLSAACGGCKAACAFAFQKCAPKV